MNSFWDNTNINFLPGIGEIKAKLITKELGIISYHGFLRYYPYKYIDRSKIYNISEITNDSLTHIQIRARVITMQTFGVGSKMRLQVTVQDATSRAELVWFRGVEWAMKKIEIGREYVIFGRPTFFNSRLNIAHPEVDVPMSAASMQKMGMFGIYSTSDRLNKAGVTSKVIQNAVFGLLKSGHAQIEETLPEWFLAKYNLLSLKESLVNIHFPKSNELLFAAQHRLKFEEFLVIQLAILNQRSLRTTIYQGYLFPKIGDVFNTFYNEKLPFPLTNAQKRVVKEIRQDTVHGRQMNRLLQGDVGSGKTIVALLAMLIAIDNGFQCCMMAPTEILATQHLQSVQSMVEGLGLNIELLKGSTTKRKRAQITEDLANGDINILISTHAVLEDYVVFKNLGLVIIDEQHRFGVEQRSRLWRKSLLAPHILVMSATPIPRTLAMTIYGDLDVSVIDELPPGRKSIQTFLLNDSRREQLFGFMRKQIDLGRQIYTVYPMIKESEKIDYKNLEDGYNSITRAFPMPKYNTSIVHGKMKAVDKEISMHQFKEGQAQILVATTVIEVGVNVPNATVMVIESAERFGLSQLHQLRGRVGRGGDQSYCILMAGYKLSNDGRKRLEAMVATSDGFELAELDLKLRGYGELEGTRQSGEMFDLNLASVSLDNELMLFVRDVCEEVLMGDPLLESEDNALLKALTEKKVTGKVADFSPIS